MLEPVEVSHAEDLWKLFSDRGLHTFVPFEPLSLEKQRERCERWAGRLSPAEDEIWLNWVVRRRDSHAVIGHLQSGIKEAGDAYVGYLISRDEQNKGFATEALGTVLTYLRDKLDVREVKAWIDTRNEASIRLVRKLGMRQTGLIKDADFFKGSSSDELVFSITFAATPSAPLAASSRRRRP